MELSTNIVEVLDPGVVTALATKNSEIKVKHFAGNKDLNQNMTINLRPTLFGNKLQNFDWGTILLYDKSFYQSGIIKRFITHLH